MERLGIGRDDRIVVYDNSPDPHRGARLVHAPPFRRRARSRSSTAASRNGSPKGGRPKAASRRRATARFEPSSAPARSSPSSRCSRRARRAAARRARQAAGSKAARPIRAPASRPGHIPGARNLPFARALREDGTFKRATRSRALFAEAGVDPDAAVRRHLRLGRHRQCADLRRASARQRRRRGSTTEAGANGAPTRRRPKATGPGLAAGRCSATSAQLAADLLDQRAGSPRHAARGPSLRARRAALRGPRRPRRPVRAERASKQRLLRFAGSSQAAAIASSSSQVRRRPAAERLDQPQRVADARQPRHASA